MTRRSWMCAVAVLACCGSGRANGQEARGDAPAGFVEARAAFNAAGAKGDKAAYARYLAPDVTWVDISGGLRDRAALIADVQPANTTPVPRSPRSTPSPILAASSSPVIAPRTTLGSSRCG